ncbi:Myb/SANT-like transcription factor [Oryctes borbonicus]|uniref:Myb/SANT-like transcription factor n=1 Tax=Oryctes borbonicus TaxID=1629725 RepID=A0A0T6AYI1_9SCAR|nr:Myb/SANT-like transcription factor [Oryctes borbonicus]
MSLIDWSNEKVLKLIAEYQGRPELWDPADPAFRNKLVKMRAWQEIASVFNSNLYEVERKFKILLVQYRRERSRIAKLARSIDDVKRLEDAAWYAYKAFSFLNTRYKTKMEIYNDSTYNFNDIEYEEIKLEPNSDDYKGCCSKSDIENHLGNAIDDAPFEKRRKPNNEECSTKVKYNDSLDDDIDLFVKYVASEMRNLSNCQIRRKLKRQILKAVLEACEEDDS